MRAVGHWPPPIYKDTTMKQQKKQYDDNRPFWLTAKYAGKCPCGFEIKPGQRIYWYPSNRKTVCKTCGKTAELEIGPDDLKHVLTLS